MHVALAPLLVIKSLIRTAKRYRNRALMYTRQNSQVRRDRARNERIAMIKEKNKKQQKNLFVVRNIIDSRIYYFN